MNKQIKTKLPFILAAILLVTFAVTGCNNKEDKNTKTEEPATEKMDSANVAPGSDAKPQ